MNLKTLYKKASHRKILSVWFYSQKLSNPSDCRHIYMSVKTTEENKIIINTKLNKIIGGKGTQSGTGMQTETQRKHQIMYWQCPISWTGWWRQI